MGLSNFQQSEKFRRGRVRATRSHQRAAQIRIGRGVFMLVHADEEQFSMLTAGLMGGIRGHGSRFLRHSGW
ncbi:hypothetical protein CO660_22430 [Rhizobium sp. L9]|nr:hypothetical protein CO660_22430 [Rhizobium sp. L9]